MSINTLIKLCEHHIHNYIYMCIKYCYLFSYLFSLTSMISIVLPIFIAFLNFSFYLYAEKSYVSHKEY